jgi:hypothetical protein
MLNTNVLGEYALIHCLVHDFQGPVAIGVEQRLVISPDVDLKVQDPILSLDTSVTPHLLITDF